MSSISSLSPNLLTPARPFLLLQDPQVRPVRGTQCCRLLPVPAAGPAQPGTEGQWWLPPRKGRLPFKPGNLDTVLECSPSPTDSLPPSLHHIFLSVHTWVPEQQVLLRWLRNETRGCQPVKLPARSSATGSGRQSYI